MNIHNKNTIFELYNQAVETYRYCIKPNNYICGYIKRKYQFKISNQEIYDIIFNISDSDKVCPICNGPIKFSGLSLGYSKTCSLRCSRNTHDYKKLISSKLKGITKSTKGKKYKEIYGTDHPPCGFKYGDDNIAKNDIIRNKISKGVSDSYIKNPELLNHRRQCAYNNKFFKSTFKKNKLDKKGNSYRSTLEVSLANLLIDNLIDFNYEEIITMYDGRRKIIDFTIDNNILIEVSGYAYDRWQKDFDEKIKKLRMSIGNKYIFLITYPKMMELLFMNSCKNRIGDNVFICSIYDEDRILSTIKFLKDMLKMNEGLQCIK